MADLPLFLPIGALSGASVFNRLPLALLILDAAGRVSFVNDRYQELFALPAPATLVGRPAQELVPYTTATFVDAPAATAAVEALIAGAGEILGQRLALRDGRVVERDVVVLPEGGWLVTYRDVTAEARARQEIERQARITAQNPNPVYQLAADGTVVFANPAALVLRDALAADELTAARARGAALTRLALAADAAQQVELALAGRVFELYVCPFPAEQCVNMYLIETTARHAAEAENRRQRAFYENVLTFLPADVVVLDSDLRYRYANPHAIRDPEARAWIIGRDDLAYAARRDRPRAVAERRQQVLRRMLADGRQVSWEEEIVHADGAAHYLMRSAQPVYDEAGNPTMIIGYGFDITPIREAEQVLARSEKQYRDLMEYTQALICTHDLGGRLLSVNPAVAQLLGYAPAELVGRTLTELLPPQVRAEVADYLASFADQREATGVMRVQPRHRAAPRYLLYHNIKVEEGSQPAYVIGYAQDISERIAAERAIMQAKEAAEAAAQARQNFLASMSHEIRTPLNGVLGLAALLAKTTLAPEQQRYVDLLGAAGRSLLALLNDVLDMSKIASGKLELAAVPFELDATVRAAVEPLALRAREQGLAFEFDPPPLPADTAVSGDPQRLTQILTNLLGNALKFTERGRIGLTWRLGPVTPAALTATFLVTDTGIGIAAADHEKIFDEFAQARPDTSQRFGGTGLGLAISERLVAQLGGRLVLSSEPGVGSTFGFTLTLPRTTLPPPPASPGPLSIRGLRVLLTEDNPVNRLLARLLLNHHGADVAEAPDGPTAVALANAAPFDVVLMDIRLPGMSGVEATTAIRALPDPARARVPIVALTANAFRDDTARYLAAGMNDCLTKPFEEADLLRVLSRYAPPGAAPSLVTIPDPIPTAPASFPATALRLGHGKPGFVRQLVAEFLLTAPALLTRIAATDPAQAAVAAALAHQLVPSARTFDAPEVAAALTELEELPATDPQWLDARDYAVQEVAALLTQLRQWQELAEPEH